MYVADPWLIHNMDLVHPMRAYKWHSVAMVCDNEDNMVIHSSFLTTIDLVDFLVVVNRVVPNNNYIGHPIVLESVGYDYWYYYRY